MNTSDAMQYMPSKVRDVTRGLCQVYLDGQMIIEEKKELLVDGIPRRIFIGQDNYEVKFF